ncbi:MAG TPA: hypothetical protein VFI55_14460 [Mycobacterium sp.]|nr:hypothetical protein [Mycobacterium sp.]
MRSGRFRQLLETPGPFVSVYFTDSEYADDAGAQPDGEWRALRNKLERQGADETVIADIDDAVINLRPPMARGGRALVAGSTGVVLNEQLLGPPGEPIVRVSELPYIVPIIEHGVQQSHYLLAVVDPNGAFITTHADATRHSEMVNVDGSPKLTAVVDRVCELVHNASFDAVFVVSDAESRSDLLAALPERVRERATSLPIDVRRGGYDFEEIQRAIDTTLVRQRLNVMDNAAERFTAEISRGSGLAAEGLDAVCSALHQGAVDTMLIGYEIDGLTVVSDARLTTVAPNADALAGRGALPAKTLRADEALPLLAISVGASVVRIDERIAPADGIAAVLRPA